MAGFSSHEVVKNFCLRPRGRRSFNEFFDFCVRYSIACLRVLCRSGYPLPIERSNHDQALRDIAHRVVEPLFESRPGRPYYLIFDFFRRHGVSDFQQATAECLYDKLTILLRGNVRHELYRLRRVEHAALEKFKRTVKDTLHGDTRYKEAVILGERYVHFNSERECLRTDKPAVPPAELYDIVLSAYHRHSAPNAPVWLRVIFTELAQETETRNMVVAHELLSAMIAVWAGARDDFLVGQPQHNPGLERMLHELIAAEIPGVLSWAQETLLSRFVTKGKLNESDVSNYLVALEDYLRDFASGVHDIPLPKYFYMYRPFVNSVEYQSRYKHTFETTLRESLTYLREILQNNPTIHSLRDYLL